MDTRQLKTLVAIANQGTFAKAANLVNLTPSAVSQQMQALEQELDTPLFDRTTRPALLNAKGLQFLKTAHSILQIVEDTTASITGHGISGMLSIGSIRTSTIEILPRAMTDLHRKYPALRFKLRIEKSETLMNEVVGGRLDLAIVSEHAGMHFDLKWTPFLREPLMVIAPFGTKVTDAQTMILDNRFLRYRALVPLASQIDTELSRLGLIPNTVAEVDTIPAMIECVKAGLGVAIVPHVAIQASGDRDLPNTVFGNPPVFRQVGIVQRFGSPRASLITELHNRLADLSGPYGLRALDVSASSEQR